MKFRRSFRVIAFVAATSLCAVPTTAAAQDWRSGQRAQPAGDRVQYSASVRILAAPRQADVFVDGSYAGTVDDFDGAFQRLRLRPGTHEIALYLNGYRTERQRFYAAPNSQRQIRFSLNPLRRGERNDRPPMGRGAGDWRDSNWNRPSGYAPSAPSLRYGTVSVTVNPYDAEIWVDGQRWSRDVRGMQLPVGRHRVEIRRAGYRSQVREFSLNEGGPLRISVSLKRG
jgi:hypothetical protein